LDFFVRAILVEYSSHEAPIWTFLMAIRVYLIHHIPQPPDAQFELYKFIVSIFSGSSTLSFAYVKHHGDCLDAIRAAFSSNHQTPNLKEVYKLSEYTTQQRHIWH